MRSSSLKGGRGEREKREKEREGESERGKEEQRQRKIVKEERYQRMKGKEIRSLIIH